MRFTVDIVVRCDVLQQATAKLLLAYEQWNQSFSVAMLVAMTRYVITFERVGRHAKHRPHIHTGAAKVHESNLCRKDFRNLTDILL